MVGGVSISRPPEAKVGPAGIVQEHQLLYGLDLGAKSPSLLVIPVSVPVACLVRDAVVVVVVLRTLR
jgi:hypothetical protein